MLVSLMQSFFTKGATFGEARSQALEAQRQAPKPGMTFLVEVAGGWAFGRMTHEGIVLGN